MESILVVLLPKKMISKDKEEVLNDVIKYIINTDKDIDTYLVNKISNSLAEDDILQLNSFFINGKIVEFIKKNNKDNDFNVVMKISKLINKIYSFRKLSDVPKIIENKTKTSKLELKEVNDRVMVFYSDQDTAENNVDDIYNEFYKRLISFKDIKEKVFYRNAIKNLNILRAV